MPTMRRPITFLSVVYGKGRARKWPISSAGSKDAYGVDEFFLWHHVGYFPHEVEMAMLEEFAAAAALVA